MGLLNWFSKRRAIKKYKTVLGPALRANHGILRTYNVEQVIESVEKINLSKKHIWYAIAMYCTKKDYDTYSSRSVDNVLEYTSARSAALSISIAHETWSSSGGASGDSAGGASGAESGGGD